MLYGINYIRHNGIKVKMWNPKYILKIHKGNVYLTEHCSQGCFKAVRDFYCLYISGFIIFSLYSKYGNQ